MLNRTLLRLLLVPLGTGVAHLTTQQRLACQTPTPDPLTGCPPQTLLVDPSASNATRAATNSSTTFGDIQSAILALPHDNSSALILVLPGTYAAQLNITRRGPLYLLGQTDAASTLAGNRVEVLWRQATGGNGSADNAFTSTLTVAPTLSSSLTGSGPAGNPVPENTSFGNMDFRAYNINFTNAWLPYSAGPSLALSTSYANTGFYHCSFKSYQDTVYVGKLSNAYMKHCEVGGQTDFLYGFGALWIEQSSLVMRGCGGGIIAWKGTNTSYVNRFGAYVHNSTVTKENSTLAIEGKCALGRPWNALHRSIVANTYLDDSIRDAGYIDWSATDPRVSEATLMGEYRTYGPGWNATGRAAGQVTRVLTGAEWEPYSSPDKVFQFFKSGRRGNTRWIDRDV